MLQVAYLGVTQTLLVFLVSFIGKVSDPKDSFTGYRAGFYAKFKKFIFVLVIPAIPDEFIFNVFQYVGG
mgnify:CR=1 FL=1